jgi:hypothetical protein
MHTRSLFLALFLVAFSLPSQGGESGRAELSYSRVLVIEAALKPFRAHIAARQTSAKGGLLSKHLSNPNHYRVAVQPSDPAFGEAYDVIFIPGELPGHEFRGGGFQCVVQPQTYAVLRCWGMK